jgi:regulation of enolase protein 1 (concanavalin A-like superfamily)
MTNREKYNVSRIVSRRESDWSTSNYMWNTSEMWYAYDSKGACCKQTATYEEMKEWLDFEEEEKTKLDKDVIFRPTKIIAFKTFGLE